MEGLFIPGIVFRTSRHETGLYEDERCADIPSAAVSNILMLRIYKTRYFVIWCTMDRTLLGDVVNVKIKIC